MQRWLCLGGFAISTASSVAVLAESEPSDIRELLPRLAPFEAIEIGGGTPLMLKEVLRSVDQHHPALAAEQQRFQQAIAKQQSARGAFDPTVNARGYGAPLGYYDYYTVQTEIEAPTPLWGARFVGGWRMTQNSNLPSYYGELATLDGGEVRGGVAVPLWRDGPIDARRAAIRQNQQESDATRQDVRAAQIFYRLIGTQAYWRWVAAGKRYVITHQLLALAELRDSQLTTRVAEGAVATIELLENRRAVLARRGQLVQAQRDLERETIALSLFWRDARGAPRLADARGIPPVLPEAPSLQQPGIDAAVAEAVSNRPELRALQTRLNKLRVAADLAKNQFSPRLDFDLMASKDLGRGSADDVNRLSPTVLEGNLRLSVPIPFRKARGDLRDAKAALQEATERATLRQDSLVVDVRDAWSAWQAATQRLELARQEAELSQAVAEAERQRFDLGATTLLIVNLREQNAADAERAVIDAIATVHTARANWNAVLGRLDALGG